MWRRCDSRSVLAQPHSGFRWPAVTPVHGGRSRDHAGLRERRPAALRLRAARSVNTDRGVSRAKLTVTSAVAWRHQTRRRSPTSSLGTRRFVSCERDRHRMAATRGTTSSCRSGAKEDPVRRDAFSAGRFAQMSPRFRSGTIRSGCAARRSDCGSLSSARPMAAEIQRRPLRDTASSRGSRPPAD
jgi:hypothetical protein